MMLLYPEDYDRFAERVKRVVFLEVLEKALQLDRMRLDRTPLKVRRAMARLLDDTLEWVRRELVRNRKALRRCGGEIVEVRQLEDAREVLARFRGFYYTQWYVNERIRSECEEMLLAHWGAGKSSRQHPPAGGSH